MAIDGFFIKHLVNELNKELKNNRLERIIQLNNNYFIFNFYYRKKRKHLAVKLQAPKASLFLIDSFKQNNQMTTNFLKVLKKELEGAILTEITQFKNDRVIILEFSINDFLDGRITKKVVIELMGRNTNLILTQNNVIIDALNKTFEDRVRKIIPNTSFEYFPTNKLDLQFIDYSKFDEKNYLANKFTGVSMLLSRFLYKENIDPFKIEVNPTKNIDNNRMYWFDIFGEDINKKHYESLSLMLSDIDTITNVTTTKHKEFIDNQIKRINNRINVLNNELKLANDKLYHRHIGDTIYSSGLNLNKRVSTITDFDNKTFDIDDTLTLNENAQKFYKSYQKAKRTIDTVSNLISELNENIKTLLEIDFFLTLNEPNLEDIEEDLKEFGFNKIKIKERQKKIEPSRPLKLTYEDTIIFVGKNNRQNDQVTHSLASKNDYWLHVKDAPGSHVVIKSSNPSNKVLEFAAMLAANYSKLRLSNHIPVSYTQVKNLRKIPGRHGSQVIVSSYKSLTINIDEKLLNIVIAANKLI